MRIGRFTAEIAEGAERMHAGTRFLKKAGSRTLRQKLLSHSFAHILEAFGEGSGEHFFTKKGAPEFLGALNG